MLNLSQSLHSLFKTRQCPDLSSFWISRITGGLPATFNGLLAAFINRPSEKINFLPLLLNDNMLTAQVLQASTLEKLSKTEFKLVNSTVL